MLGITSQLTGVGLVGVEGNDNHAIAILFGVDPSTYPQLFKDTYLVEGSYLQPGQEGLVVSRGWLASAEKSLKTTLTVGDKVIVNGFGRAGFKIREATIVGVVDFNAESEGMSMIAWANADTVRLLSGVDITADDVTLSKDQTALLNASNESDIFGSAETTLTAAQASAPVIAAAAPRTPTTAAATVGSWQFILVRLKDSGQATRFISDTNTWLGGQGIAAKAAGW